MTRLERLTVLVVLVALVAAFVVQQPLWAGLGALLGIAGGVATAQRLGRLRRKVDARIGEDLPVPRSGLRVQVVVRRVLLQIAVLGVLLLVAALTPFTGERVFAIAAAAVTALPAVLTAQRLRG